MYNKVHTNCLACLSVCLFVHLSVCVSVCLHIILPAYLYTYLPRCLSVYPADYLSACLPTHQYAPTNPPSFLPFFLLIHLATYLSLCWSSCVLMYPPKSFYLPVQNIPATPDETLSLFTSLPKKHYWIILMTAGGHFAGAVFSGKEVLTHKTFHRYTVRAKRGTAQGARDSQQGGKQPK